MRYFRRRWDEKRSWWYFATDDEGVVAKQVEIDAETFALHAGNVARRTG